MQCLANIKHLIIALSAAVVIIFIRFLLLLLYSSSFPRKHLDSRLAVKFVLSLSEGGT